VGERIVVPFLLRQGIHEVDAVVLSHPHGDHAGGLAPVLRRLRVEEFADGGQRYGGHAYRDAIATAHEQGVPIVLPRAGAEWRTDDGVVLHFIGPSLPFIGGGNAINSNSVAFLLTYGRFRMLFTGDAGSESEERFLSEGADLRADVLKVGHHGSAYGSSPAFIAAVRPRYAVVSVGRHNLFGHPAPSTLDTLWRFGARIYRTDEDGAVTIVSDGWSESVATQLGDDETRGGGRFGALRVAHSFGAYASSRTNRSRFLAGHSVRRKRQRSAPRPPKGSGPARSSLVPHLASPGDELIVPLTRFSRPTTPLRRLRKLEAARAASGLHPNYRLLAEKVRDIPVEVARLGLSGRKKKAGPTKSRTKRGKKVGRWRWARARERYLHDLGCS